MLEIRNLKVQYLTNIGTLKAVDNVSFAIDRGERIGIVGESGCGKTSLIKAIVRILPSNAKVDGEIIFKGQNLHSM